MLKNFFITFLRGALCQDVFPLCERLQPCMNGGICRGDAGDAFRCLCQWGFAGRHCNKSECRKWREWNQGNRKEHLE